MELAGKRITVMGLGSRGGGAGVARFLVGEGAVVTVTDGKSERELQEPLADLEGLPIRYVLGGHEESDFTAAGASMVIRNPAVRGWSPWLAIARKAGVPIEMEMSLFLRLCPAPAIGITGTKGKTSTAALCGEILRQWRPETVVAGNMGVSAVARLAEITVDTPVVLELSNWQLEGLDEHKLGPHIAVLTNISEDHLDTYDSFEHYATMKRSISRHLGNEDVFIANADDPESWLATRSTRATVVPFSSRPVVDGISVSDGSVAWSLPQGQGKAPIPDKPFFRGAALQRNVAAAVGAAIILGAETQAVEKGLLEFGGIRDRSELVATIGGVQFINDTSATAPAAVVAALAAQQGKRVHVIAGGAGKGSNLRPLADAICCSATTVALLEGTATPQLNAMLDRCGVPQLGVFSSMDAAVSAFHDVSSDGDVVLLSPGCASFGLFRDEFDRGEQFRRAVAAIQNARRDT